MADVILQPPLGHSPTLGMVRELARAGLGEAGVEDLARWACGRRGLIARGRLTATGQRALSSAVQQHEARHG